MSDQTEHLDQAAAIVSAYVSNNRLGTAELPSLIADVASALRGLVSTLPPVPAPSPRPAVPIKKSVTPEYLISLEDGLKFKSLKRALRVRHGLSPDQYRAKWGLPADYPMVAPNYSRARSEMAKSTGLGRKQRPSEDGAKAPRVRSRAMRTE